MGIFGKVDIASAADYIGPPADAYKGIVTKFEVKATAATADLDEADQVHGLNIAYTISEGPYEGYDQRDRWFKIPAEEAPLDPEERVKWEKARTALKKRIMNFGVPEARINDVEPDDILGLEVIFTTKMNAKPDDQNPTYISGVQLADGKTLKPTANNGGVKGKAGKKANPFE